MTGSQNSVIDIVDSIAVSLCSYNMHGMKQGCVQLTDLCQLCDVIFVQEHWLLSSNLDCFDTLSSDHIGIACSSMDDRCSKGILKGRPFGGLAVLIRRSFCVV